MFYRKNIKLLLIRLATLPVFSVLVISALFLSTPVYSAQPNTTQLDSISCKQLFEKIDKQSHQVTNNERNKQLIALENALFDAIAQCKMYSGMFVLMGELQIEMGQIPLAVVYGRKAVELDAKYWRAHKLLGSSRMLNQQSETGLEALRTAYSLAPDNLVVQLNLTGALIENKKHDEALSLVNKIIELNDHDHLATAYYLRSQAYNGKGLVIEAQKDAKRAQELGFALRQ